MGESAPETGLVAYTHPGGMTLSLPPDWERAADVQPGLALISLEPEHGGEAEPGFRANLVVTVDQLDDGLDLDDWQAGTERLFPQSLDQYQVLDLERLRLAGVAAIRRLAHHRTEQNRSVTMEQWAIVLPADDGRRTGWTLTASVGTLDYADAADMFAHIAAGWRPPGHPDPAVDGTSP